MKPIQCTVCRKFYDAEKYDACPHCEAEEKSLSADVPAADESAQSPVSFKPERHGLRGIFRKKKKEPISEEPPVTETTESVQIEEKLRNFRKNTEEDERTIPIQRTDLELPTNIPQAHASVEPPHIVHSAQAQPSASSQAQDDRTMAYYNFTEDTLPVVGWLVCVRGAHAGRSFELHAGRNYIGRSEEMQIRLPQEPSIAWEKHACVTYDPQGKSFFLQGSEDSGTTCVRGVPVCDPVELKTHDEITLGSALFVFVRLCSTRFSWERYAKST